MEIDAIGSRLDSARPSKTEASGGEKFADAVARLLRDVNRDQIQAARKIQDLTVEGKGTIPEAMIAMSRAEGSFRLVMEMRNRIVDGINQLLRAST